MKTRTVIVEGVVALLAFASIANASISVTSGDFSTTTASSLDVADWYDYNGSAWWSGASEVFGRGKSPFSDTSVILGDAGETLQGVGGRWIYQSIGTKQAGVDYFISLDFGQPTDGKIARAVGLKIDIYAGSFAGAADNVDITTAGLTLVDSLTTPTTSAVGAGVYTHFTNALDLASASTSDLLWVRISNLPGAGTDTGSWAVVDNVQVIPEPATLGLVGLFGVGVLFVRRRFMI